MSHGKYALDRSGDLRTRVLLGEKGIVQTINPETVQRSSLSLEDHLEKLWVVLGEDADQKVPTEGMVKAKSSEFPNLQGAVEEAGSTREG